LDNFGLIGNGTHQQHKSRPRIARALALPICAAKSLRGDLES
jgi:hypothetical protein